jgi:hypothetical protein
MLVVGLALAAPAFGDTFSLSSGETQTWTGDNGFTQDTYEAEEMTNIHLTVNGGGFLRIGALKVEDGDSGSSTLDIANGTVSLNQLVGGKDGPMVTTIGDGGVLRIDPTGTTYDQWCQYGTDDAGSSINLVGSGMFVIKRVDDLVTIDPLDEAKIFGLGGLNLAGGGVTRLDAGGFTTYTVAPPDTATIVSIAGGDWNDLASWDTNAVPIDTSDVTISHTITLQPPTAAPGVAYTLAIDGAGTLNVNNELTITEEITIAGALHIGATGIVNAAAASTANMTFELPGITKPTLNVGDLTIETAINMDNVNVAIASNNITIASGGELSMGAAAAPYVSTGDLNVQGTLTNATDITVKNITMAAPYAIGSGRTLSAASGTLAAINTAGIATIDARGASGEITATNLSIANGGTLVKDGSGKLSFSGTSTIGTGVVIDVNAGHIALASAPTGLDTIQLDGATFETTGVVTAGFAPGLLGAHLDGNNFDGVNDGNLGIVMGPLGGRSNGEHWNDETGNHTSQLVYEGQIYLDGGPTTFVESVDDGTRLIIDGQTVLDNGTWNDTTHGTIDRLAGWYDVEIRFRNGDGGYGPGGWDGWNYNLTGFGFGMDINGNDNEDEANFVFPLDPGTGSGTLFRVASSSTGEIVMDTTDVVVTADSSLIANTDSTATFGSLNFNAPATLTTSGANDAIIFADTTVTDGVNGFNTESNTKAGGLIVGAANATIVKTGAADLILDPSAPTIGAGSLAFDVRAGRLIAQSGSNPLGVDSAIGINGGEVVLSSSAPATAATFDNPITSTGGTLTVGAGGGANIGPLTVTLGNATTNDVTLTSGTTLLVQATDDYTLNIAGNITGGGNVTIGADTPVITQGAINAGVVTINGSLETNGAATVSDLQVIGGQLDLTGGNMATTTVTVNDGGIDTKTNALVVSSEATLGVLEITATTNAFELSGANLNVDTARTLTLTGGTVTIEAGYDAGISSAPAAPSAPSAAPTDGIIFSVDHNNLPAVGESVTAWDGFSRKGGDPTVVEMGGEKWMQNLRDTSDRLRQDAGGYGDTPISIDGATIVTAINPIRHASGNPWTSIVDIFYDQLCIGVLNETGQIKVKVSGANGANPIWTSAADKILPEEPGVLSLSVDNTGAFEVFWRGVSDEAAVSMGTGNGNLAGAAYNALYPSANGRGYAQYMNIGGNDPDPWPTYNGLIGDTYVYNNQLSSTDLAALQDEVRTAMGLDSSPVNLPGTTVVATETSTLLLANVPGSVTLGGIEVAASKTLTIASPSTDIQLTNLTLGADSQILASETRYVEGVNESPQIVTITVAGTLTAGGGISEVGDWDEDTELTNLTLADGAVFDWTFGVGDNGIIVSGDITFGDTLTINVIDGGGSALTGADIALFDISQHSDDGVALPTIIVNGPDGWTFGTDLLHDGFLVSLNVTTSGVVVSTPGDATGDHIVDDADLAIFTNQFGVVGAGQSADFDDDGDVDLDDFGIMRGNWGFGTGGSPLAPEFTPTPEPATMSLLTLGGLAILRRRRRRS